MNTNRKGLLGYSVALSVAVAVVLAAIGYAVLAPRDALAQLPDSGAQYNTMIHELKESNQKLAEIATLLREIRDQGATKDGARKDGRPTSRP